MFEYPWAQLNKSVHRNSIKYKFKKSSDWIWTWRTKFTEEGCLWRAKAYSRHLLCHGWCSYWTFATLCEIGCRIDNPFDDVAVILKKKYCIFLYEVDHTYFAEYIQLLRHWDLKTPLQCWHSTSGNETHCCSMNASPKYVGLCIVFDPSFPVSVDSVFLRGCDCSIIGQRDCSCNHRKVRHVSHDSIIASPLIVGCVRLAPQPYLNHNHDVGFLSGCTQWKWAGKGQRV